MSSAMYLFCEGISVTSGDNKQDGVQTSSSTFYECLSIYCNVLISIELTLAQQLHVIHRIIFDAGALIFVRVESESKQPVCIKDRRRNFIEAPGV